MELKIEKVEEQAKIKLKAATTKEGQQDRNREREREGLDGERIRTCETGSQCLE